MTTPDDPADAAAAAVDEDRLLEGENPATTWAADAELWRSVYAELVDFKQDTIARIRERVERMQPRAGKEVAATDLSVMHAEEERLRRRLRFWTARAAELGAGADGTAPPQ